jgi:hypothetical protein
MQQPDTHSRLAHANLHDFALLKGSFRNAEQRVKRSQRRIISGPDEQWELISPTPSMLCRA